MPYLDIMFWTDKFVGFRLFLQACVWFGEEWWSPEPCKIIELGYGNSSRSMVSWVGLSRDIKPLLWPWRLANSLNLHIHIIMLCLIVYDPTSTLLSHLNLTACNLRSISWRIRSAISTANTVAQSSRPGIVGLRCGTSLALPKTNLTLLFLSQSMTLR